METSLSVQRPEQRILDFDIETIAAGYADPSWVPDWITCVAWSWVGEEKVEGLVCGPEGIFYQPEIRRDMLSELLLQIAQADVLTGHNITRFDLRVINAEAMRLGLEPVREARVQDTMALPKAKGFKKGQDNLSRLHDVPMAKQTMDWQEWQDAYAEPGWPKVLSRCRGDVLQHKQLRARLEARGNLKPARRWTA